MNSFYVDSDISIAKTINKNIYSDEKIFNYFKNQIFPTTWQFIGDVDSIPNVGDILPFNFINEFIEEPLILIRNKEQKICVLSNVCTHRGNVLAYEKCNNINGIFCKYHGRRFNLDGKLVSMPEFKEVKNFPSTDDDLHSLPVAHWSKFLFTSISPNLTLQEVLAPMLNRISWLPINEFFYRSDLSKDYHVEANWALYCENYLEGFHIPFVHSGLNEAIDFGTYETICDENIILQIGYSKNETECFDLPSSSIDFGKQVAAYYYWVAPNMMFNFYPWGLSINIIKPISVSKTKVSFLTYMWKEDKYDIGAGSELDKVEFEDEEIVLHVQQGLKSRFYNHGRYSVTREQGTHHFHLLLSKYLCNYE
jgi:choline monooxygenase